jgi:hypothetical protein
MSIFKATWQDLKSRKLLPLAAVLLVAIVAVPIVLSNSSSTPAPTATGGTPAGPADGLPAVSETTVRSNASPRGHARDPFASASGGGSATKTTTTTTSTTTTPSGGGSTGTTPSSTTTPTGGGTSPSTPSSSNGGSSGTTTPTPAPKTTTPGLSSQQSYNVSLAITNTKGGVDTVDPLRLAPLPSANQPVLVELGVLKGGSRVVFAVQPGTVVSGPGSCVPGPIDCEILSLAPNQTENLSVHTATGNVQEAMFAVTGIKTVSHASRSATLKARNQESKTGREMLDHDHSALPALSLFHYDASVGAVVDLRNLTLGNS